MKNTIWIVSVMILLLSASPSIATSPSSHRPGQSLPLESGGGGAWVPCDCGDIFAEQWQEFAGLMAEAEPGTPLYAPVPFPVTDGDFINDFEYHYLNIWQDTSYEQLPVDQRALYQGIISHNLTYEVLRVENWEYSRCEEERPSRRYGLVRAYSENGSYEIARFAIAETGLASMFQTVDPAAPQSTIALWQGLIIPLDEAVEIVAIQYGLSLFNPEYISPVGSLRCDEGLPCIGLRSPAPVEDYYILKRNLRGAYELWVIPHDAPRYSLSQMRNKGFRDGILRSLSETRQLANIGYDCSVIANLLAPR